MYKFSENTTAEFYGRKFYEIQNESGKCVAYSERVFEIPEAVKFLGGGKCLIFEKANFLGGDFRGGNFYGGNFKVSWHMQIFNTRPFAKHEKCINIRLFSALNT